MYKATVDAVNGLKVLAGGKWLKCIGNRSVKVGDRIWTDGKCVYGNDDEAQSSIVIIPTEIFEIPLLFWDKDMHGTGTVNLKESYCCIKNSVLKKMHEKTVSKKRFYDNAYLINNPNGTVYVSPFLLSSDSKETTDEFETIRISTIAVNIDKRGNLYELRKECTRIDYHRYFGGNIITDVILKLKLFVIKNNEILNEIDLTEKISEEKTETENFAQGHNIGGAVTRPKAVNQHNEDITYTPYIDGIQEADIKWGVIEDENNWAVIFHSRTETASHSYSAIGNNYNGAALYDHTCYAHHEQDFVITQNQTERIFNSFYSIQSFYNLAGWSYDGSAGALVDFIPEEISNTLEINPFKGKLQIQDGFYFNINDILTYSKLYGGYGSSDGYSISYYEEIPSYMDISIFSPNDIQLWKGKIVCGSYLTICKDKKILLGIDDNGGKNFSGETFRNADIKSGLYYLDNGQCIKIFEGYLRNQKLRPMKNFKNWWNKIRNRITA